MRKKWVRLVVTSVLSLSLISGCGKNKNNKSNNNDSEESGGNQNKSSFALVDDKVVLETTEDLNAITPFNDYFDGSGAPELSLNSDVKKFGDNSIKVFNPSNPAFDSDNSWPSIEISFKKPQDFSKKKYTQFHIYSEEDEPFVMNVQYSVDGSNGYKDNIRQINPGWNVIEITNNVSRDYSIPFNFAKITSFIVSVWGHASKTCTYDIDDIVLTDESAQSGDIYELVTLEKTSFSERHGGNFMVPWTMFIDSVPNSPTIKKLTDDGKLVLTQNADWHFLCFNCFNTSILGYSTFAVDIENIDNKEVEIGIAADGGDYNDHGSRIYPSSTMVRKKFQPGEKATLSISVADIENALKNADESLSIDNIAFFHVFSVGDVGVERTFAISSFKLLTAKGILINEANKVSKKISRLPETANLRYEDIETVLEIRKEYNALSEDSKPYVTNLNILEAAEARINSFTANDYAEGIIRLIATIPAIDAITLDDEKMIKSVREAYNSISSAARALVTNLSVLEAAEEAIDKLYAKQVDDLILALPSIDSITLHDRLNVVEARNAYIALTSNQKKYVENLTLLAQIEAKIAEKITIENVIELISELTVSGRYGANDVKAVLNAKQCYEDLSSSDQASITNVALLNSAISKMLTVKRFDAQEDSLDLIAGLYGPLSEAQAKTGYVESIGGQNGGFGWFSSEYIENTLTADDTNNDGYMNDAGYIGAKFTPANDKEAYKTLLDAGYTKITFDYYQEAESGSLAFFARMAYENAFVWEGQKQRDQWYTFTINLSMFVKCYDQINSGDWFMFGGDVNKTTTLTKVYFSDIVIS